MQDNFDINKWRMDLIREGLEETEKQTPKDNNFSQAEDSLYKKVTGEDPKPSSKNKFRKPLKESLDQIMNIITKHCTIRKDQTPSGQDFINTDIDNVIEAMEEYGELKYSEGFDAGTNNESNND